MGLLIEYNISHVSRQRWRLWSIMARMQFKSTFMFKAYHSEIHLSRLVYGREGGVISCTLISTPAQIKPSETGR